MSKGGSAMSGRDIQKKITDTKGFLPNALAFEEAIKTKKPLELETLEQALEFLTLFAVLLMTNEPGYQYNDNRLLETYQYVKYKLKRNRKVACSEFLSSPKDFSYLVLWGKLCFVR